MKTLELLSKITEDFNIHFQDINECCDGLHSSEFIPDPKDEESFQGRFADDIIYVDFKHIHKRVSVGFGGLSSTAVNYDDPEFLKKFKNIFKTYVRGPNNLPFV